MKRQNALYNLPTAISNCKCHAQTDFLDFYRQYRIELSFNAKSFRNPMTCGWNSRSWRLKSSRKPEFFKQNSNLKSRYTVRHIGAKKHIAHTVILILRKQEKLWTCSHWHDASMLHQCMQPSFGHSWILSYGCFTAGVTGQRSSREDSQLFAGTAK